MPNYKSFDDYFDYSLNQIFGEPVIEAPVESKPTIQNMPQTAFEKALESSGVGIEQAAQFLESLGSINIGGVDFTLRDLMPVDEGMSQTLKTAGSGMPLTTGSGLQTTLKPEVGKAGIELSLLGPVGSAIGKVASKAGKKAMQNKAKLAIGAGTVSASEATKQKATE